MPKRPDILEQFGRRVRTLREEAGPSQEGFAAHAGFDRTYQGGIERGQRNIALRNIEKIAKGLGVNVAELFEGILWNAGR